MLDDSEMLQRTARLLERAVKRLAEKPNDEGLKYTVARLMVLRDKQLPAMPPIPEGYPETIEQKRAALVLMKIKDNEFNLKQLESRQAAKKAQETQQLEIFKEEFIKCKKDRKH